MSDCLLTGKAGYGGEAFTPEAPPHAHPSRLQAAAGRGQGPQAGHTDSPISLSQRHSEIVITMLRVNDTVKL